MPRATPVPPTTTDAVRSIEDALTTLVRRARLPRTHQRLMDRAGVALEGALYPLLARVEEHQPVRLTALAQHLGVDASTASRQATQLEQDGLVVRRPDPDDGRAATLSLSPEGLRALERIRRARGEAVSEILADWSERDRARLADLLERLVADIARFTAGTEAGDTGDGAPAPPGTSP